MRHRKSGVKLNRTTSHRQAMFRNMVTSLFKHDRIRTTDVKAKELRRWADHVITLAKRGDLHARRQVLAIMREKEVVHKLFEDAQKRFGSINGGYTRIVKIGQRPGDAAPISLIELVAADEKDKKAKKKAKSGDKKKRQVEPKAAATAPVSEPAQTKETVDEPQDAETEISAAKSESADSEAEHVETSEADEGTDAVEAAPDKEESASDETITAAKEAEAPEAEDESKK